MENNNENQKPDRKRRRLYETVEETTTSTTNEKETQQEEKTQKDFVDDTQSDRADEIIQNHMHWTMGMDFMPIKAFDNIGITNLQIRMVHELADLYDVYYSEISGKAMILSLIGKLRGKNRKNGLLGIIAKTVPVGEMFTGIINKPQNAGASTYAIGKTFKKHFENGGSLVSFNATEHFEYFQTMFTDGLQLSSKFINK